MTENTQNSLIGASAVIVAAIIGGLFLYFSRSTLPAPTNQTSSSSASPDSKPPTLGATPTKSDVPLGYGKIFNDGNPYPIGFDKVRIGTPVSVLKSIYPDGDFDAITSYDIHPKEGPFSIVAFYYDDETKFPTVNSITLHYRNSTARDELRQQALTAFGSKSLTTRVNGTLVWPNIKGCSIEVGLSWVSLNKNER